jgi:hypothetical protein
MAVGVIIATDNDTAGDRPDIVYESLGEVYLGGSAAKWLCMPSAQ